MYRRVRSGLVLEALLRARGFDPDHTTLSVKERQGYGDLVNSAVRRAWEWARWPELMVCEQRRYRPAWSDKVNYGAGEQVWFDGEYWVSLGSGNVGNVPLAGGSWWGELRRGDWVPFLPMVQTWRDDAGRSVRAFDATGVDLRAVVYGADPLLDPRVVPVEGCEFWEGCVVVPGAVAPAEPFVRFRPMAPVVSFVEWMAGRRYSAGEVCFWEGESWVALVPDEGTMPGGNPGVWGAVGVPLMFFDYVRMRAGGELASEDEGKWRTLAMAEEELERLEGVYLEGTRGVTRPVARGFRRGVGY